MSKGFKRNRDKSDGVRFLKVPHVVLASSGYRGLGHTARSLLMEIGLQYNGSNNGRLVACGRYLKPLGWTSNDTISRALKELLAAGLLIETRKGARPNRAAWFALGWLQLDQLIGLDIDIKHYRTGGYNGASLNPSGGVVRPLIAPSHGVMTSPTTPAHGSIQ
jgi:hypothetical protein